MGTFAFRNGTLQSYPEGAFSFKASEEREKALGENGEMQKK